jgi:hypothetical protein
MLESVTYFNYFVRSIIHTEILLQQILKHKIDGIRRISSHPLLPLCKFDFYYILY